MPIASADIHFRLSGGASNADVNASLGGVKSSNSITTNIVDNFFDSLSGTESAAGDIEYRCLYFHNGHGTLTAQNSKVYLTSNTTSANDTLDLAVGTAAINGTEQTVANESTAPTGVTWVTTAASYATGVALGNIPAGQHIAVWIRRTVDAGAAAINDNVATLEIGIDTAA